MDHPRVNQKTFNDLDTAFHVAIAEAGRNRLVADMTIAIRDSMSLPILRSLRVAEDWDVLVQRLRAGHHGIYDAIASGAGELAADLVDTHQIGVREFAYDARNSRIRAVR
jgi:GntR family transcriptional repressor for pyruvate dehydrogenase complex